ncbi:SMR domain-containing protein At5g58720-like [Zingiber officinale]|uniref:SMR domain-containing protein At5g58720-like n=1 Tax=Zingiber officinale TaxID=94328 RepID=UPI001C4AC21D|nr:SMR domain-containing protein At5g58720-like [Zingiber officinale]
MKPTKKNRKSKKRRKPAGSDLPQGADEANGDDGARALEWLIEAFSSSVSLDQIDSAYREAGCDPFKAAGILGAQLDDPGEKLPEGKRVGAVRKQKRAPAATGIVPDVIGKGYIGSVRRSRDGGSNLQFKDGMKRMYSVEEAEQFLCSMLGDMSEITMAVVRDVLDQCGNSVEKALEALLDISTSSSDQLNQGPYENDGTCRRNYSCSRPEVISRSPSENSISFSQLTDMISDSASNSLSEKEHIPQVCHASSKRNHPKVLADCEIPMPYNYLQQQVLESLFRIPNSPTCEPGRMNWKKVVEKVESFGQGLEFSSLSIKDQENLTIGKEDIYQVCRDTSKKHWEMMQACYQKAAVVYSRGQRAHASFLSEKGKFFRDLAREGDEQASREIFEARNKHIKNVVTIDLHGQHVKQAIRLLKLHLLLFTYIPSVQYLKVITGCGADVVGKGKMKRSVLALSKKEGIVWTEENVGTLLLHIGEPKQYSFVECDSDSD